MSKITGGAAFPQINQWDSDRIKMGESGMTLRDYFAAKAMQGLICAEVEQNADSTAPDLYSAISIDAYSISDAMLKAREA